jgi:hypothetical protein
MARTSSISQNYALFVSSGSSTGGSHGTNLYNIWGLQSLNWEWSNPKQDVQVYGIGAPVTRETIQSPQVTVDFSYLVTTANNEHRLGLEAIDGSTSVLTRILNQTADDKNYFIYVAPQGQDAVGRTGSASPDGSYVIGIGNGFVNSYSIEGAVGGYPTASVQVQGLNLRTYTSGVGCPVPAVSPTTGLEVDQSYTFSIPYIRNAYLSGLFDGIAGNTGVPAAIRPGDITLTLTSAVPSSAGGTGLFYDYATICPQSFNASFDLNRQEINCLGSRFATNRSVSFPITVNFEVETLAKDMVTGSLAQFLCTTGTYNASIVLRRPSCANNGAQQLGISLRNLSLEGQSVSTSVGSEPVTFRTRWIGQVGGATDFTNGLFMSGAVTGLNGIY